jgi:hypothetical protein
MFKLFSAEWTSKEDDDRKITAAFVRYKKPVRYLSFFFVTFYYFTVYVFYGMLFFKSDR